MVLLGFRYNSNQNLLRLNTFRKQVLSYSTELIVNVTKSNTYYPLTIYEKTFSVEINLNMCENIQFFFWQNKKIVFKCSFGKIVSRHNVNLNEENKRNNISFINYQNVIYIVTLWSLLIIKVWKIFIVL